MDQLQAIIENNRDLILDSPYINKASYSKTESGNIASDDDIIAAVTSTLVESFVTLSYTSVNEDEFKSCKFSKCIFIPINVNCTS